MVPPVLEEELGEIHYVLLVLELLLVDLGDEGLGGGVVVELGQLVLALALEALEEGDTLAMAGMD